MAGGGLCVAWATRCSFRPMGQLMLLPFLVRPGTVRRVFPTGVIRSHSWLHEGTGSTAASHQVALH